MSIADLESFMQTIPCAPVGSPILSKEERKEKSILTLPENNVRNMTMNDGEIKRLKAQGFTNGLVQILIQNNNDFPLRLWIIDNSGSMNTCDGQRIIPKSNMNDHIIFIKSTRWAELRDTVEYHSQMAAIRNAPTIFRFLNHPGVNLGTRQFSIAETLASSSTTEEVQNASNIMRRARPSGATPMIDRLLEIHEFLAGITPQFENKGGKVAVIITTDGLPTVGGRQNYAVRSQFVETLRMFEDLPVWFVIRLCTEEEEVVKFYNELDEQLEFSLDVLSDFVSEAKEVYRFNKWLNYALPLHRIRECGYHDQLLDLLDERSLCAGELRDFCEMLFGRNHFEKCDPEVDWKGFLKVVNRLLEEEDEHYNPIKKKLTPWIDTKVLNKIYGKRRNLFGF